MVVRRRIATIAAFWDGASISDGYATQPPA